LITFAPLGGCYSDTVFAVGRKHTMEASSLATESDQLFMMTFGALHPQEAVLAFPV
jgi:hypothetical protein